MTKDLSPTSAHVRRYNTVSGAEQASRRRDKHVTRACNTCRHRKCKCDGRQPICAACQASNQDCTWTTEEDGRRPVTKNQVEGYKLELAVLRTDKTGFENRIRRLEEELTRHNIPVPPQTPPPPPPQQPLSVAIPGNSGSHSRNSSGSLLGLPPPSPIGTPSPVSATMSLPSPSPVMGDFLTVPGSQHRTHRSTGSLDSTGAFASGMSSSGDEGDYSDSESEMSYASTGKHLMVDETDGVVVAVNSTSPLALALSTSPPHSPHSPSRSRGSSFSRQRSPSPMPSPNVMAQWRFPGAPSPPVEPPAAVHALPGLPFNKDGSGCPCDWARYLPREILMQGFNQSDHDTLLHAFFLYGSPVELGVLPHLFLRDMRLVLSDANVRAPHYSPALHNALLAIACAFAPPGSQLASQGVRAIFAKEARDRVESEVLQPVGGNLAAPVRALAVLARYHLGQRGGAALAFLYFGMALRLAQRGGLNIDCTFLVNNGTLHPADRWERDVSFWALFVQDVDLSVHVGQELSMPPTPVGRDPPAKLLSSGESYAPDSEAWQYPGAEGSVPAGGANTVRTFAESIELFHLAARVMKLSETPKMSEVTQIHTALAEWESALPEALQIPVRGSPPALPHVLVLHIRHAWVMILLHRPFCMSTEVTHGAKTSAQFVAENSTRVLRLLKHFQKLYTLARAPLACVQAAFAAASVALLRARAEKQSAVKRRNEALGSARDAVTALREMSRTWGCAGEYAEKLDLRIDEVAGGVLLPQDDMAGMLVDEVVHLQPVPQRLPQGGQHAHSLSVPELRVHTTSPKFFEGDHDHRAATQPVLGGGGESSLVISSSPLSSIPGSPALPGTPYLVGHEIDFFSPEGSGALFNQFGGPAAAAAPGFGVDAGLGLMQSSPAEDAFSLDAGMRYMNLQQQSSPQDHLGGLLQPRASPQQEWYPQWGQNSQ